MRVLQQAREKWKACIINFFTKIIKKTWCCPVLYNNLLISIAKGDKNMKLIMAITLSLSLVGCLSSQGQSPDSKVSNQEVHKEVESQATHATSLREREKIRQSSQY